MGTVYRLAEALNVDPKELVGEPEADIKEVPTPEGEHESGLSPAFFRLRQGLEPYDISESDADFLVEVYKAHIKRNQ